jgi:hypothetical protein
MVRERIDIELRSISPVLIQQHGVLGGSGVDAIAIRLRHPPLVCRQVGFPGWTILGSFMYKCHLFLVQWPHKCSAFESDIELCILFPVYTLSCAHSCAPAAACIAGGGGVDAIAIQSRHPPLGGESRRHCLLKDSTSGICLCTPSKSALRLRLLKSANKKWRFILLSRVLQLLVRPSTVPEDVEMSWERIPNPPSPQWLSLPNCTHPPQLSLSCPTLALHVFPASRRAAKTCPLSVMHATARGRSLVASRRRRDAMGADSRPHPQ